MQPGQQVNYYAGEDADAISAEVVEIVGAGASLAKRLNLRYRSEGKDRTAEDVPHEGDAEGDGHFWLMKGERRSRTEPEEDSPPDLAVPDGARIAPALEKKASGRKR